MANGFIYNRSIPEIRLIDGYDQNDVVIISGDRDSGLNLGVTADLDVPGPPPISFITSFGPGVVNTGVVSATMDRPAPMVDSSSGLVCYFAQAEEHAGDIDTTLIGGFAAIEPVRSPFGHAHAAAFVASGNPVTGDDWDSTLFCLDTNCVITTITGFDGYGRYFLVQTGDGYEQSGGDAIFALGDSYGSTPDTYGGNLLVRPGLSEVGFPAGDHGKVVLEARASDQQLLAVRGFAGQTRDLVTFTDETATTYSGITADGRYFLIDGAMPGYVLTSDAFGIVRWAPPTGDGYDGYSYWSLNGTDIHPIDVAYNVAIGDIATSGGGEVFYVSGRSFMDGGSLPPFSDALLVEANCDNGNVSVIEASIQRINPLGPGEIVSAIKVGAENVLGDHPSSAMAGILFDAPTINDSNPPSGAIVVFGDSASGNYYQGTVVALDHDLNLSCDRIFSGPGDGPNVAVFAASGVSNGVGGVISMQTGSADAAGAPPGTALAGGALLFQTGDSSSSAAAIDGPLMYFLCGNASSTNGDPATGGGVQFNMGYGDGIGGRTGEFIINDPVMNKYVRVDFDGYSTRLNGGLDPNLSNAQFEIHADTNTTNGPGASLALFASNATYDFGPSGFDGGNIWLHTGDGYQIGGSGGSGGNVNILCGSAAAGGSGFGGGVIVSLGESDDYDRHGRFTVESTVGGPYCSTYSSSPDTIDIVGFAQSTFRLSSETIGDGVPGTSFFITASNGNASLPGGYVGGDLSLVAGHGAVNGLFDADGGGLYLFGGDATSGNIGADGGSIYFHPGEGAGAGFGGAVVMQAAEGHIGEFVRMQTTDGYPVFSAGVEGWVEIGSATDPTDLGDFSSGIDGYARLFYDQSEGAINLFSGNGVATAVLSANVNGGFLGLGTVGPFGSEQLSVVGDAYIGGKLTVVGALDPISVSILDTIGAGDGAYYEAYDGSGVAPVGPGDSFGRIRYNNLSQSWEASTPITGGWLPIGGGGPSGDGYWSLSDGYILYPQNTNYDVVIGGTDVTGDGEKLRVQGLTLLEGQPGQEDAVIVSGWCDFDDATVVNVEMQRFSGLGPYEAVHGYKTEVTSIPSDHVDSLTSAFTADVPEIGNPAAWSSAFTLFGNDSSFDSYTFALLSVDQNLNIVAARSPSGGLHSPHIQLATTTPMDGYAGDIIINPGSSNAANPNSAYNGSNLDIITGNGSASGFGYAADGGHVEVELGGGASGDGTTPAMGGGFYVKLGAGDGVGALGGVFHIANSPTTNNNMLELTENDGTTKIAVLGSPGYFNLGQIYVASGAGDLAAGDGYNYLYYDASEMRLMMTDLLGNQQITLEADTNGGYIGVGGGATIPAGPEQLRVANNAVIEGALAVNASGMAGNETLRVDGVAGQPMATFIRPGSTCASSQIAIDVQARGDILAGDTCQVVRILGGIGANNAGSTGIALDVNAESDGSWTAGASGIGLKLSGGKVDSDGTFIVEHILQPATIGGNPSYVDTILKVEKAGGTLVDNYFEIVDLTTAASPIFSVSETLFNCTLDAEFNADVQIDGKLTVDGYIDPIGIIIESLTNDAFLELGDGQNAVVSGPGTGRLIYNDSTQAFMMSVDGGPYRIIGTGGGGGDGYWERDESGFLYPVFSGDDIALGSDPASIGVIRLNNNEGI